MSQGPYNPYPPQPHWGPAQQPQKSGGGSGKTIAIGCVLLLALCCIGGGVASWMLGRGLLGTEIASTNAAPGQPFLLSVPAGASNATRAVWIDYDASFTQGLGLQGTLTVSVNGSPTGQHQMNFTRNGQCENPIVGQSSSRCINTVHSNFNGQGSGRGKLWLFDLPQGTSAVAVTGNVMAGLGVTTRRLRFYVTE